MKELFEKYLNEGDIDSALLVGRNIINRTPYDKEAVCSYFEFLIELAENLPALEERRDYIDQADVILAYVSENAELTEDYVKKLTEMKNRAKTVLQKITQEEDKRISEVVSEIERSNSQTIKKIYSVCDELREVNNQADFDKYMLILSEEDGKIEKDYLSNDLKKQYDLLTKECTELISSKMQELEHAENIKYNSAAVESFSKAFDNFKENENLYKKDIVALHDLVSDSIFSFDTQRLFSETLIYYNHIYQYIFEKLDEEGKLALTRIAIEASKKRV